MKGLTQTVMNLIGGLTVVAGLLGLVGWIASYIDDAKTKALITAIFTIVIGVATVIAAKTISQMAEE
ncbi:Uncharacterised protein [Candidatus Gugararchaeum adminiculabundum]|nr:Uncharacterised protein [Candidatus Gugararchaeum adminiculabundum]